ncbi:Imm50 family immunity protein [Streptomyces sp. SID4982]|nr:Imm50 family immunity protein [Streptomyces sp. SID4982]
MSWTSVIFNPQGVTSVYGGEVPPLSGVRVREIRLLEDGPALVLRFDLSTFPDRAPEKWVAQGFNTVQLEIMFSGLRSLSVEGFGVEVVADVVLSGGDGVSVVVTSPVTQVRAVAQTAFLSRVSAYQDAFTD